MSGKELQELAEKKTLYDIACFYEHDGSYNHYGICLSKAKDHKNKQSDLYKAILLRNLDYFTRYISK